ncbi:MAG TPA: hypothetical protein VN808_11695 [Stellaceae bacterium]|nr:hypothetical protein [Stellaceae bacterium]
MASGLLSASIIVFCHMGDVAAPEVAGYCFGLRMSGRCEGVDATLYLFPGTIFGVLFAALSSRRGWIGFGRFIAFIGAAGIANAVAVFVCVWLTDWLGDVLDISFLDLPAAIAGAVAGAAGGALLGRVAATLFPGLRLRRSVIAASALGLLVPVALLWEVGGVFLFYIVWQAGYAVALASSLPSQR